MTVALVLLVAQALGAAMAMPGPARDGAAATDACCDCCMTCDDEAMSHACPVFCSASVAHLDIAPAVPRAFELVTRRLAGDFWSSHADPPDPAPPKRVERV